MRSVIRPLAMVLGIFASQVAASDNPVVVELYTSQGCSSCPPADAYLKDVLASREDVIALALHVDYWDYIGWKDEFANPDYTKRQQGYARAAGTRTIYTPQMIIGGQDHVIGAKPGKVSGLIDKHKSQETPVSIATSMKNGTLTINLNCEIAMDEHLTVQLVRYTPEEVVDIQRGENAGREIAYANIVTDWNTVAEWDTSKPLKMMMPVQGDDRTVVIVQRMKNGPIIAASRVQ